MEVVDVKYIGSNDQYQTYSPQDMSLINTVTVTGTYGAPSDYIEYFIKDLNGTVLSSNYYASQYTIGSNLNPTNGITTQIYLDPEKDARTAGYNRGSVNLKYNFFSKQLASSPNPTENFWIKEISTSRTEVKAARQDLSNTQLSSAFTVFNAVLAADPYYPSFYLNFGSDIQVIAINAVYVEEEGSGYVIFKLYEPLPIEFDTKSTFWVVTEVADPAEFNVAVNVTPETVLDSTPVQGPNFKIPVKDKINQTTPYYNYTNLLLTSVTSSYQQLKSLMQEKGIQINVDYSDFSNFIHFSSATERLYNFVYKLQLIESASVGLTETNTDTAKVLLQKQIDNTITNFDGYEYYLYFNSSSTAWPKQTETQPYELYSVTSSQAVNWLGSTDITPNAATMSMYFSSSYYDDQNKDLLIHSIPGYLSEDPANTPYLVFLNMIGQHFDNIWIYLKDVTNHYSAENNPFVGISMDQVSDALRSFGIQLYTNTSITDNIYYSLLGINQTGSALPVTSSAYSTPVEASSSLYPLSGSSYLSASLLLPPFAEEKINKYVITFITGSNGQAFETLPSSQIQDEVYKRIYHNLPYLLKTRGTERGVKALVTTFGIPDDILSIHEYGGYNYYQVPGIQEISNTRILTGSVASISSSLLSPYTTTQYYEYTLEKTANDVEVAFSPADSINASITSSGFITSSLQPGYFNIMQYIGAPNLQYSSSYTPLVALADNYFAAEYTSKYNVWDFIRVIKYYNNSLFKMLRDWVPARSSADTGIVIKSHMLERNKYPRHEPTFVQLTGSANYDLLAVTGSSGGSVIKSTSYIEAIPVQYQSNSVYLSTAPGLVYVTSSNNIQKFTGEFSGSTIVTDVNTFTQDSISSYVYPWTSSVAPSEHGGTNIIFTTYSVSPVINNVTGAVISQRFLDLDFNGSQLVATNYGLVTQSLSQSLVIGPISQSLQPYSQYAQLQDYNYNLPSTVAIRYSGSYLSGLYYNTQSIGDISYGTDPVINYYSDKLGFFTQVQTSSFLPGRVNATLGYLADVSGGLFELNQNNKHWTDVQNIFVAGTTLTVKQFDNKKYSNQVTTDGIKTIYNSGYSYTPQLYFLSGSDQKVYFQDNGGTSVGTGFTAVNSLLANAYISGSSGGGDAYPVTLITPATRVGSIYRIFNSQTGGGTGFTAGTLTTTPSYIPTVSENLVFNASFNINLAFQSVPQTGEYTFRIMNGSDILASQVQSFTTSTNPATNASGIATTSGPGVLTGPISGTSTVTLTGPINVYVKATTATVTYVPAYGQYVLSYSTAGTAVPYGIATGETVVFKQYQPTYLGNPVGGTVWAVYSDTTAGQLFLQWGNSGGNNGWFQSFDPGTAGTDNLTGTLSFNLATIPQSFNSSDNITFQLTQSQMTTANFTASLSAGSLAAVVQTSAQGNYPYATASISLNPNGWYIDNIVTSSLLSDASDLTFTTNLSQFFQYQQVPGFISASNGTQVAITSSLYAAYGDINYTLNPAFGDKLVMSDFGGNIQDLNVVTASYSSSTKKLKVTVAPQITGDWQTNPKLIYRFLLLKRYENEQNVILTFNKAPGPTSYGFIIPDTINPSVTANINALQAAVQSQLLSNQSIPSIDTINGGTFN
jgi:hypothetical protein